MLKHELYARSGAAINKTERSAHLSAEDSSHMHAGSDGIAEHHEDVYLLITGEIVSALLQFLIHVRLLSGLKAIVFFPHTLN